MFNSVNVRVLNLTFFGPSIKFIHVLNAENILLERQFLMSKYHWHVGNEENAHEELAPQVLTKILDVIDKPLLKEKQFEVCEIIRDALYESWQAGNYVGFREQRDNAPPY